MSARHPLSSPRPAQPRWLPSAVMLALACLPGAYASAADESPQPSQEELEKQLEAARARLEESAREVAELSQSLSGTAMPDVLHFVGGRRANRAMLGMNIGPQRGADGQKSGGVAVLSVSPGGPAEAAGIKAGDVIVSLNGKPLQDEGKSNASSQLLRLMRDVKPGEKVALEYRRDGRIAKADVVTQALALPMAGVRTLAHGVPFGSALPQAGFGYGAGAFRDLELVGLTPKLGQYFGTDKGLLVVRTPQAEWLKLEDGDVILDIAGREPANPAHAFRILGSYQSSEKLTLNVMRHKKKQSIAVQVPADAGGPRFNRSHFEHRLGDPEGPDIRIMTAPAPLAVPLPAPVLLEEGA